jgi:endonuclease/exonuclease/phosphatase family metal-dependent hydrolase
VLSLLLAATVAAANLDLEVLGQTSIPGDLEIDETPVGGLSGLTYDPGCNLFYAISDDKGRFAPPRFYTLTVSADDGGVEARVLTATLLRDADGLPYMLRRLDAEALALTEDGELFVASEGMPFRGIPPEITRFGLGGSVRGRLAVPEHYIPRDAGVYGVRENLGFESVAVSPDGSRLFAAVENALAQDGPMADLERASPSRLLVFALPSGQPIAEYVYQVAPAPLPPRREGGFVTNGISELVALDSNRLLVVERAFAVGSGNSVRVYLVDLSGASDVHATTSLRDVSDPAPRAVRKRLLADLGDLGVDPDNIEAMALGPVLEDGRRMLVMISDNNFQPEVQETQVVVAAISGVARPVVNRPSPAIYDIQGAGHESPLVGRCVDRVTGVVTAILGRRGGQAFWMQDASGDGDASTSDGLLVTSIEGLPRVEVGDRVHASGRVEERSWNLELPVTRLFADRLTVEARGAALPDAVTVGAGGRSVPQPSIAAPRFSVYDPGSYAADFFESLEGMRVTVEEPVVVGPTSRYGEIVVLGDGGRSARLRTRRGGVLRLPDNPNPQRLIIDDAIVGLPPRVAVGDRFDGPVTGVLHFTYGSYKLLNTAALPGAVSGAFPKQRTRLTGDASHVTVATFNLENLSATADEEAFARRASVVVDLLDSPDVLAVQEVQDDSGANDDGTVTSERTIERFINAIEAVGGPRYQARWIDPVDGADGGRPGANIRCALLFNPARVEAVDRGRCSARVATEIVAGPELSCSPGVLSPDHWAYRARDDGDGGSRKALVAEFRFAGAPLFVVNLHLLSKGGDDPLFGRRQPRVENSSVRRLGQAEVVAAFTRELLELDRNARIVVLGDLNDFPASDALTAFAAVPLANLMQRVPADDRYTFVYLGNSQVLDHVLVSSALADGAEVDVVHANADHAADDRASDHDPVIVRLEIRE